jgi:hypothetical protein
VNIFIWNATMNYSFINMMAVNRVTKILEGLCAAHWDRILLCSSNWPQTHDLPASAWHLLRLQACTATPGSWAYFFRYIFLKIYSSYKGRFIVTILVGIIWYISYIAPIVSAPQPPPHTTSSNCKRFLSSVSYKYMKSICHISLMLISLIHSIPSQ